MSTSVTIQSLIDTSRDMDTRKGDYADYRPAFVAGDGFLEQPNSVLPPIGKFALTDHALTQLCGRLGPAYFGKGNAKSAPRDFVKAALEADEFKYFMSGLLNAGIEKVEARWFVRTYQFPDGPNTIRAILSDKYAPIQNTDVLGKLAEAFKLINDNASAPIQPELYKTALSPDRLDLRFRILGRDLIPNGENTPYGIGGYISNDEIGSGALKVLPALWRGSCDNTFTWAANKEDNTAAVNVRHIGTGSVLADRMAAAIAHCLQLGGKMLEQFMYAKQIELPDLAKLLSGMADKNGWSEEFKNVALVGTEGQQNLYGLVNGVTYGAHTVYGSDPAKVAELEALAGSWVMKPESLGLKTAELVVEN